MQHTLLCSVEIGLSMLGIKKCAKGKKAIITGCSLSFK